jgi:hypothetical protein
MIYIGFNPHYYFINGVKFDPDLKSRYSKLLELLSALKDEASEISKSLHCGLNIMYMYYSRDEHNRLEIYSKDKENELVQIYEPLSFVII